jgi:hypothetical protein
MRALIVLAGFVLVFAFLAVMVQSESPTLFATTATSSNRTISSANDVLGWNSTTTINMSSPTPQDLQMGGHDIRVESVTIPYRCVSTHTFSQWWIFRTDILYFQWFLDGELKSVDIASGMPMLPIWQIESDYIELNMSGLHYDIQNDKFATTVDIAWNITAYSNATAAFDAEELYLTFNNNFDDRNTSINAWNMITMLLTFDIPGLDWRLRMIMVCGVIGALSYLIFIFALRIIGAVFGGGGA